MESANHAGCGISVRSSMKNFEEEYDVLIVGAGPSGAVAAKRLAEEGYSVIVLEQGPWPNYENARAEHADYELTLDRYWPWDPNRDPANQGYPFDVKDSEITPLMWNGVGGSALLWAAQWQRQLPSDFRVRS